MLLNINCDSVTDSKATSIVKPELISPADNETNVPRWTRFTWRNNADVLWIDKSPAFNNPTQYSVSGETFTVPSPLEPNIDYYWKAGVNVAGSIEWSQSYFRFTTGNQ